MELSQKIVTSLFLFVILELSHVASQNPFSAAMQSSQMMANAAGAAGGDMVGQELFIRHPGLEQQIKDAVVDLVTDKQAKKVQAGKLVILDNGTTKDVIIPGGMYHYFRVEVAKLVFHLKLKHVLPYTFTIDKIVGPLDADEPLSDELGYQAQ